MPELFYEETVNVQNADSQLKKFKTFRTLSIISYTLLFLWLFIVYFAAGINTENPLPDIILLLFPAIILFMLGLSFGLLKNKFCVEYDYSFISGTIRVSRVIANLKRKNIYDFEFRKIEKIGYYDSETYNKYQKSPGVKCVYLTANKTPMENKDFYYIVANLKDGKKLMLIECTKSFIMAIIRFTGMTVLERGFK